jgi:hypothetical protein
MRDKVYELSKEVYYVSFDTMVYKVLYLGRDRNLNLMDEMRVVIIHN